MACSPKNAAPVAAAKLNELIFPVDAGIALRIHGDEAGFRMEFIEQNGGQQMVAGEFQLSRVGIDLPHRALSFSNVGAVHTAEFSEGQIGFRTMVWRDADSGLIFLRMRCDHPGGLTMKLGWGQSTLADYRSLRGQFTTTKGHTAHALLWLYPFESEVTATSQQELSLQGEGEFLFICGLSAGDSLSTIEQRWKNILLNNTPDGEHPDLSVLADRLQQAAESAAGGS